MHPDFPKNAKKITNLLLFQRYLILALIVHPGCGNGWRQLGVNNRNGALEHMTMKRSIAIFSPISAGTRSTFTEVFPKKPPRRSVGWISAQGDSTRVRGAPTSATA
jgi:hypothetical protein